MAPFTWDSEFRKSRKAVSMVKEAETSHTPAGAQSPAQKRSKHIFYNVCCFLLWISWLTLSTAIFRKSSQQSGVGAGDKAEMAFKLYDRDKDGYITKAEMVKLSKNLTKDQVEKVDIDREKCRVIIQYESLIKLHSFCLKNDIDDHEFFIF